MKVIGFDFKKISAEKINESAENIKINTQLNILDIKELKTDLLKGDDELLKVSFSHVLSYDPNYAKIDFTGNLLVSADKNLVKKILEEWKDKKMPDDFKMLVFNVILKKSNLKALQLEEEINIPTHIPFPSIKTPKEE